MFGVGTELATSADAPTLGVVYKMVELDPCDDSGAGRRYTVKLSEDKHTLPGAKQIFRYADRDVLGRSGECPSCPPGSQPSEALLRPVIIGGRLVEPLPTAGQARAHAAECMAKLPGPCHSLFEGEHAWPVDLSPELECLFEKVRGGVAT
jgi:nicotinate phosphoribosyltransferase